VLNVGNCPTATETPIHVVAAEDRIKQLVIVITAYEPTLNKWEPDKKTSRKHA